MPAPYAGVPHSGRMRLFLGGGGSPDDERALLDAWVQPGLRVVYWPFALEPEAYGEGARWWRAALGDAVHLDTWRDLSAHSPGELDGADVLLVGGGNTYALLDHIRRNGWAGPAAAWVRAGGTFMGDSAGAVLAGDDIDVARFADPNDVGITDTTGLALLPGVLVRPHYEPSDVDELRAWARGGATVLGLPERGGVVVEDGVVTNPGYDAVAIVTATSEQVLRAGQSSALPVRE